jgi:glutamate synthase domain-containing protein 3
MTTQDLKTMESGRGAVSNNGYLLWWLGWGDHFGLMLANGPAVVVDALGAESLLAAGTWREAKVARRCQDG